MERRWGLPASERAAMMQEEINGVNGSEKPDQGMSERELARLGKLVMLGQLAPGVIHEINNPLFAILGLLEFLLPDAEPGSKGEQRLQLVQQSGLEIKEIVRSILDFARERTDEVADIELDAVVGDAMALFHRTSVARDVESRLEADGGPFVVRASRNRLKVVFLALLTNAQQAMPRGGTVTVTVARDADRIVARVTDTGEGVPAGVEAHIFEPFFTTRGDQGAVGIGLSIARAAVSEHGGDLSLARATGPGATFVISLPSVGP
jgi:signal transduction histidine kinase